MTVMFFDGEAHRFEIQLLDNAWRLRSHFQRLTAIGTAVQLVRHGARDLLDRKGGAKMGRVSRLTADQAFRFVGIAGRLGRLDNIRRRRFRRGRGVLLFLGQLFAEFLERPFQVTDTLEQFPILLFKFRTTRTGWGSSAWHNPDCSERRSAGQLTVNRYVGTTSLAGTASFASDLGQ